MKKMHPMIKEVLITEEDLQARINTIAAQVSEDYAEKDVLLVAVLKGAVYFMADISRKMTCPLSMDFMAVSSYGNESRSSGVVRIVKDLDVEMAGRHVLIIEDIIDTGLTLKYLVRNFEARGAASVEVCALLLKEGAQEQEVRWKYVAFEIPNEFVVGYGLDFAESYRDLPYIGVLKPEAYQS